MEEKCNVPEFLAVVGDDNTDAERTQKLAIDMMKLFQAHYLEGPEAPARVYEILNALAACTAITIGGSDSGRCGELFRASLNANLELIYKAQEGDGDAKEAGQSGPTIY